MEPTTSSSWLSGSITALIHSDYLASQTTARLGVLAAGFCLPGRPKLVIVTRDHRVNSR